jgi:signal transduction histidine kinase
LARPTQPKLIPVAAENTLKEIQELMSPQLGEQAIELKYECSGDVRMLADAHQLKQVLINLVTNASECIDGGGTITLRARQSIRELRGTPTDVAVIEVADTGPGIPLEIQKRIFDPFFSTKSDGTGLGLAIASEIVDKHRGSLEFDTESGKGTVFRILLPAGRNGAPNEKSPAD